jgi:hypothetical protein
MTPKKGLDPANFRIQDLDMFNTVEFIKFTDERRCLPLIDLSWLPLHPWTWTDRISNVLPTSLHRTETKDIVKFRKNEYNPKIFLVSQKQTEKLYFHDLYTYLYYLYIYTYSCIILGG